MMRVVRLPVTDEDRAYDKVMDAVENLHPKDALEVLRRAEERIKAAYVAFQRELG